MAGLLASALFFSGVSKAEAAVVVLFGAIWLVGLLDDLRGTSPFLRLAVDFGCGAAISMLGWRLFWFSNPYVDALATIVFLAFAVNSLNLLDGMDGITLTVSGLAGIGFVTLFSGTSAGFASGIAWIVVGLSLAMLIHNYPPARIFLGDSGSTLLGAVFAFLCLDWVHAEPATHSIVIPLIFVLLPIADACAAVIRRVRGRQSPFNGDRRHFYDLLLRRGWTVPQILTASAIATLVFISVALAAAGERIDYRIAFLGCLGVCGFIGLLLGSFDPEPTATQTSAAAPQLEQSLNE